MPSLMQRAGGSLAVKALPAIYGAGLIFFVVRTIPLADFGRYGMAIAYLNLLGALSRGLWGVPLVIKSARGEARDILAPAFFLSGGTAIVGGIGALILLPLLNVGLTLSALVAAMLLILVPRDLALQLCQAHGKIWQAFVIEAGYFIGSLSGFLGLAVAGHLNTAEAAMSVNIVAAFISAVVGCLFVPVVVRPGRVGNWREIVHMGKWVGMMALGEIYLQQGDVLLLGVYFQPERIAPYVAARTLLRMYTLLSQAVNFIALPVASRLAAAGDFPRLRARLRKALGTVLGLLLPANIVIWFAAESLFPVILGESYRPAVPFFRVLIFASFLEPVYSVLINAVVGAGMPQQVLVPLIAGLAFNFVANMICLPAIGIWSAPVILVATYMVLALGMIKVSASALADRRASVTAVPSASPLP